MATHSRWMAPGVPEYQVWSSMTLKVMKGSGAWIYLSRERKLFSQWILDLKIGLVLWSKQDITTFYHFSLLFLHSCIFFKLLMLTLKKILGPLLFVGTSSSIGGFPGGSVVKNSPTNAEDSHKRHRRFRFDPWVWKTPWNRKWQLTPVFLSEKSHGQRSLVGYSL